MARVLGRFLIAVLVLIPVGLAAQSAQPVSGESQKLFRSSVDLVTIQASVRDNKGRPMKGLRPVDFEVRDNGQVRPILSLRADLRSPISLAILVDMSGSMSIAYKIDMARQAYDSILSQLRTGDEVALFAFDSELHVRQEFTSDLSQLRGALSTFEPFGSTSLYDATAETARKLAARSATHKAIIVLTDGTDTSSRLTASEVSGLASSIDVPVYIVATVPSVDHRAMLEATERSTPSEAADLRDLAEWTGGQLVFASTFTETVFVATSLVGELRQQYVLAIEAANSPEWRRLDVRVKHPSAVVKARNGYFGG
ncbi:MAG TPA: VWA domain-containing protein [Vicinamibacterales bacterium]|jgi:VWFA-related protein|nr:VWA domain-containing protein [Vicinamibacterales bacterium]